MDTRLALRGGQRHRPILPKKALILALGKVGPTWFAERMQLRQDLVEDNSKSPHVNLRVVAVGQLLPRVEEAAHLRRDVRKRADLGAGASTLVEPFGVVKVTKSHPNWQRRRNQDVLGLS